jgi:methylisocitrate lyase
MNKTRVHHILDQVGAIAFPGVYDTLSAKICQRVGFPMGFVSGYSVAATAIGQPDFGLLTQTEMIDRARRICMSVEIPIIVDADTGYGNPLNVYRTVDELIQAGAAGCFLEDQVWPKKCGHMRGKKLIGRDDYLQKIRAAVEARGTRDFFIVARTDALAVEGMEEAVSRVTAARESGADASFIEAPNSVEELAEIGRRAPAPVVANMLEGARPRCFPPLGWPRWDFS